MKRSQPKQPQAHKSAKKQMKADPRQHSKTRNRKTNQNTASTLGSRSSMDSKLNRRKPGSQEIKNLHCLQLLKCKPCPSTESTRKDLSHKFALNLESESRRPSCTEEQGMISYREYCMMGDRWVPLLTPTQRDRLVNPVLAAPMAAVAGDFLKTCAEVQRRVEVVEEEGVRDQLSGILQALDKRLEEDRGQFQQLPREIKMHYCKLLKNTIEKLEQAQRTQQILQNAFRQPLESAIVVKSCQQQQLEAMSDKSPIKSLDLDLEKPPQTPTTPCQIEQLIKIRELQQMGIQLPLAPTLPSSQQCNQKIDTSIVCVQNYIKNILSVIGQTKLSGEIVGNVKMAWGFPRKDKLQRIRAGRSLGSCSQVLPEYLFQWTEDQLAGNNLYEFIHNKCIFDCLNSELNKLKPFYESNGEGFPWNFRLASPLTFFEVEQGTLAYAFEDMKTKIFGYCSLLCGLIIDAETEGTDSSILATRRQARQDMMIRRQVCGVEVTAREENGMENQAVRVMDGVCDLIFQVLVLEFVKTL